MPWAPQYASTAELRAYLRIPETSTADDTNIALSAVAASRAIDHACNRQFGVVASAEARLFTARWDRFLSRYMVDIDDLMTTTNLAVVADDDDDGVYDDASWTVNAEDGFYLTPANGPDVSMPWTGITFRTDADSPPTRRDAIQVTAVWGWTAVPDTVKMATLLQGSRFFMRQQAPFGVAGSPELGSELRLLQKVDVDVAVMLRPYIRQWGSA